MATTAARFVRVIVSGCVRVGMLAGFGGGGMDAGGGGEATSGRTSFTQTEVWGALGIEAVSPPLDSGVVTKPMSCLLWLVLALRRGWTCSWSKWGTCLRRNQVFHRLLHIRPVANDNDSCKVTFVYRNRAVGEKAVR